MRVIRASEIGEYVFCHRAWWLRHVQGFRPANTRELAEGAATHARHGWLVGLSSVLRVAALIFFAAALLLFIVSFFFST
jgi:CRISPR/Cas system-associated exonuclease Cas4 (RecB family)